MKTLLKKRFKPPKWITVKGRKFFFVRKKKSGVYVYGYIFSDLGKIKYEVTREWFSK